MSEEQRAATDQRSRNGEASGAVEVSHSLDTQPIVHLRLMALEEEPVRALIEHLKTWFASRLRVTRIRPGRNGDWLAYGYVTAHAADISSPDLHIHPTPRGLLVQHGEIAIAIEDGDLETLAYAVQQHRRQKRSRARTKTR